MMKEIKLDEEFMVKTPDGDSFYAIVVEIKTPYGTHYDFATSFTPLREEEQDEPEGN